MPGYPLMPGVVSAKRPHELGGFYAEIRSDRWRLSGFRRDG
ncbi:MAG: hypothetical protein U0936_08040 [Planctomycetaceae bacterium]